MALMSPPTGPLFFAASLREIEHSCADLPLMQRAGEAAAAWAEILLGHLPLNAQNILILAGPGNNGGDAFVAAQSLRLSGRSVRVLADPELQLPADATAARNAFLASGGTIAREMPTPHIPEGSDGAAWSLVIDGLFGIGLTRAPAGHYAQWIATVNALNCPILALDCPSGLNADTGRAYTPTVRATHTLTFLGAKPGLFTADGPDFCGDIQIADLAVHSAVPADGHQLSPEVFTVNLKKRAKNTHKGSFGSAGILGGGKSMVGAALLAGRAALKLGTGRVYLGLLDADASTVDALQPELMLRRADTLLSADLRALACGPGLGKSAEALRLVEQAIKAPLPLVLDADALNVLAEDGRLEGNLYNRVGPVILTPHPAEAARLLSCSVPDIQGNRIAAARQLARNYNAHVALKGCGTVVVTVDGRWWINSTGNPGMATAGMGDVLTGMIVALLAQGWSPEHALLGGVYLHGAAADHLVSSGIGPVGLTAGEVIDAARQALNACY